MAGYVILKSVEVILNDETSKIIKENIPTGWNIENVYQTYIPWLHKFNLYVFISKNKLIYRCKVLDADILNSIKDIVLRNKKMINLRLQNGVKVHKGNFIYHYYNEKEVY